MQVSGYGLFKKSDNSLLQKFVTIPSYVEYGRRADGSCELRAMNLQSNFDDGTFAIRATTWVEPDTVASTTLQWTTFVGRFTDPEWAAVQKAINGQVTAGNGGLARWIALSTVNGVDVGDAKTLTYKGQLVGAGILTSARADVIFSAP